MGRGMFGDLPLGTRCLTSGDSPRRPLAWEGVLRFWREGSGLPDIDLESRLNLLAGDGPLSREGDDDLFLRLTSGLGDLDMDLSPAFFLLADFPRLSLSLRLGGDGIL